MRTRQAAPPTPELIQIRRESLAYACNKPNKAPPADSPNRPALAHLWWAGYLAVQRNPKQKTFIHRGTRFGVVFVGNRMGVLDCGARRVVVLSPTSIEALQDVLNGNTRNATNY